MTLKTLRFFSFLAALSLLTSQTFAAYEEEEMIGYDSIVTELNRETETTAAQSKMKAAKAVDSSDPFDSVLMHVGVGLANPVQKIRLGDGSSTDFSSKGVQASLGIDLLSEHWMAEGTARSFGDSQSSTTRVSLKEFELKILYKDQIVRRLGVRAGAGLSGRYMTIDKAGLPVMDYVTPSSVATLGLDVFLTDRISMGADLSARNSMISDTVDRNSVDATLRLDTHF